MAQPTFQQFMAYSSQVDDSNANMASSTTRVTADPDTHQDFQPTSKGSDSSLHDIVAQVFTCTHDLAAHLDQGILNCHENRLIIYSFASMYYFVGYQGESSLDLHEGLS